MGQDKFTNTSRGFAYVEMGSQEEATKAIEHMHDGQVGSVSLLPVYSQLNPKLLGRWAEDHRGLCEWRRVCCIVCTAAC